MMLSAEQAWLLGAVSCVKVSDHRCHSSTATISAQDSPKLQVQVVHDAVLLAVESSGFSTCQ